jgi:hypothetical protein
MTMKKTLLIVLAVLIGLIPSSLMAQSPPNVSINLSFTQDYYSIGQAVSATITLNNAAGAIYLNGDFFTRNYYLEIKVIDPAGRTVPAERPADAQQHSMQPLPFVQDATSGKVYEMGPCSPWVSPVIPANVDLRQHYDLSIPGRYLAVVQLSAMQYADSTCDVSASLWQGVLESNVATFYMAGDTTVSINPATWPYTWKSAPEGTNSVTVTLTPPTGVPVSQLETGAIYLNDVYSGNATVIGNSLSLTIDGRKAIDSLGTIQQGQSYKVRVAGWYKGGGFFGGISQVAIGAGIIPYTFSGFFAPVDNPPMVNTVKAGQTVPVKWRVMDANGQPVASLATKTFTSTGINCSSLAGEPESAIEPSSGTSGWQYLGNGYWQYNWKTSSGYANTCRTMVLTISSDSGTATTQYTANFKFKK